MTPINTRRDTSLRRTNLPLLNDRASFHRFNKRRSLHLKCTILCIRHDRIKIHTLLRVSLCNNEANVNNNETSMRRILRAISTLLRQRSSAIRRNFNVNTNMINASVCHEEHGIEVLFRQRHGRQGRPCRRGRCKSKSDRRQPFCGCVSFRLGKSLVISGVTVVVSLTFLHTTIQRL